MVGASAFKAADEDRLSGVPHWAQKAEAGAFSEPQEGQRCILNSHKQVRLYYSVDCLEWGHPPLRFLSAVIPSNRPEADPILLLREFPLGRAHLA
jgi:hypothetical protein